MENEVINRIWPEWELEKQLGKGSYGVVYKAVRKDHNVESYAAIKVISVPSDPGEVETLRSEGLDETATKTYFEGIVQDFVGEIQLMESLKGVQNIVGVEDYRVVERTGAPGFDICIRMELLTPFTAYIREKTLTEEEIIRLGCDMCTALEICSRRNIIHRDLKPENIFINDFGYFKLGDFGIARKLENMTGGMSQKGTFNYMAPEVANSAEYDARVDLYSLGIVLYRLLNKNLLPFLDIQKQLNPNERRLAVDRRMRGEALPPPSEASPAMAEVILRACAYDPDQRFASATEMKQALESVRNGTYQMQVDDCDATMVVRRAPGAPVGRAAAKPSANTATRVAAQPAANTDPDATVSVRRAPGAPAGRVVPKPAANTDPDATVSVRRAPGEPARRVAPKPAAPAGHVAPKPAAKPVNTFGTQVKKKNKRWIVALSAILGAVLMLGLAFGVVFFINPIGEPTIDDVISQAETYAKNRNYESALSEIAWALGKPYNFIAKKKLREKETEYTDHIIDRADTKAEEGIYGDAIAAVLGIWENFNGGFSDYENERLSAKADEYCEAWSQQYLMPAEAAVAIRDYETAVSQLKKAAQKKYLSDCEPLLTKLEEYEDLQERQQKEDEQCAIIRSKAQNQMANRRHDEALAIINEGLETYPNSQILLATKEECQAKQLEYENMMVSEYINWASYESVDGALGMIRSGLEEYPNNELLLREEQRYLYIKKGCDDYDAENLADAKWYANQGKFGTALRYLGYVSGGSGYKYTTSLRQEITKQYKQHALEQAAKAAAEKRYAEAIDILTVDKSDGTTAVYYLRNDAEVTSAVNEYTKMGQIHLTELREAQSLKTGESKTDTFSNRTTVGRYKLELSSTASYRFTFSVLNENIRSYLRVTIYNVDGEVVSSMSVAPCARKSCDLKIGTYYVEVTREAVNGYGGDTAYGEYTMKAEEK